MPDHRSTFSFRVVHNTTWISGIIKQLHKISIWGMIKFLHSFLTDKLVKKRVGNTRSHQFMQEGVPQASVISMTLFSVAINSILNAATLYLLHVLLLMTLQYNVQVLRLLLPVSNCKDVSIQLLSGLIKTDLYFHQWNQLLETTDCDKESDRDHRWRWRRRQRTRMNIHCDRRCHNRPPRWARMRLKC